MSRQNKPSSIKTLLINNKAPFQFVEAYKTLRTNLQFSDIDQTVNKLIVTSSIPGEGKSTVSINLAISLAQLGKTVLLVDTDLRKPLIHKYLHLSGVKNGGVTTALTGRQTIEECITHFSDLGIYVMPAGPIPPNPSELLQSKMMRGLVGQLEKKFDFIVFDTPPVSVVTDAAILSGLTDGVVFVLRQNFTPIGAAQNAKSVLENVGARVLGCVLNSFDIGQTNKSYSYYQYKKDYKYGE